MLPSGPFMSVVDALQIVVLGGQTHGLRFGNHECEATNGSAYQLNSSTGIPFLEATPR